jgi:hypothetical protein
MSEGGRAAHTLEEAARFWLGRARLARYLQAIFDQQAGAPGTRGPG